MREAADPSPGAGSGSLGIESFAKSSSSFSSYFVRHDMPKAELLQRIAISSTSIGKALAAVAGCIQQVLKVAFLERLGAGARLSRRQHLGFTVCLELVACGQSRPDGLEPVAVGALLTRSSARLRLRCSVPQPLLPGQTPFSRTSHP